MKLNFKSIYLLGLYVQCSTHVYMQFLKIPKELVNTQLDQPVENSRKVFLLSMPKCHKNCSHISGCLFTSYNLHNFVIDANWVELSLIWIKNASSRVEPDLDRAESS